MQSQGVFIFFVVFSFVLALLIPIVAICVTPLQIQERLFLLVGQLMTSSTMLGLTKQYRDISDQEALKLRIGCTQTTPTDVELTMAPIGKAIANGRSLCVNLRGLMNRQVARGFRFTHTRA